MAEGNGFRQYGKEILIMDKWADYCISAVRYDEERKHIDKVWVHGDNEDGIGCAYECPRSEIIAAIGVWKKFITIIESPDGNWIRGEDVCVVNIGGRKFLRTGSDCLESDSLGSLPEF